ncbi:MAG: mechanosensitive ion channel family protein [Bacteroidales bacterium]|nr:mechanosensitive ion channel family protein [Bacteroidales bacterium]
MFGTFKCFFKFMAHTPGHHYKPKNYNIMNQFFDAVFWSDLLGKLQVWIIEELPGLLILTLIVVFGLRLVRFLLHKLKKRMVSRADRIEDIDGTEAEKRINTLMGILRGLIRIVVWTMYAMIVLKKFNIDIGPILASAGIVGLAVGFGAQELVRDFISGFYMLLENHIRTGDIAIINGTGGLVERIALRTVTLRDFSGVVHVFQNGKISSLSNMTKEWSAVVFDIGVAYKEDTETVMNIMKQVGDELKDDPEFGEHIIEPIEVFGLDSFGDSAIVIKARLKTKPIQQWAVGREYRKRLKRAFDERSIEIPFPHTTIYWGEEIKPLNVNMNGKLTEKAGN